MIAQSITLIVALACASSVATAAETMTSQVTYGKDAGEYAPTSNPFQCPGNAYIVGINGTVSSRIRSLRFVCSDGTTSDCYGGCGPAQNTGYVFAGPGEKGTQDQTKMMQMYNAEGFSQLYIKDDDNQINAMFSAESTTGHLTSESEDTNEFGQAFPSPLDPIQVQSDGQSPIITGFQVKMAGDDQITMLKVMYRVNTTDTFPGVVRPKPAFTLAPGSYALSAYTYGSASDGRQQAGGDPFVCPEGAFVQTMTATVSDLIESFSITCSDGTVSSCYGLCNALRAQEDTTNLPDKNNPKRRVMTSTTGFSHLTFIGSQFMDNLKSYQSATGNILSSEKMNGQQQGWPSDEDMHANGGDNLIVVGFDIKSNWYLHEMRVAYKKNVTTSVSSLVSA
ncbi:hypothetical protein MP228_011940 [Amoeboaphelidium protococcarum]|nr:hypothetical protein MP228_011940 [Amoeboaphelidium protococcarum]